MYFYLLTRHPVRSLEQGTAFHQFLPDDLRDGMDDRSSKIAFSVDEREVMRCAHPELRHCYEVKVCAL